MKLLIAGSRTVKRFDLSPHIPPETELIISGGAAGVDTLAERYADAHGISKLILRPDYRRYGRAAPLKRNERMVELADALVIIWDGSSRGTDYTHNYAKQLGKPIDLVLLAENEL